VRRQLWPETIVISIMAQQGSQQDSNALGRETPFIETVARRGYRFLADVAVVHDGQAETVSGDLA
jgi:DNA-binding winged helix-turn-helix (wHTH) protein